MRFPLRLTAELAKAKIVRMVRGSATRPIILRVGIPVDVSEESPASPTTNSTADDEILKQLRSSDAPIVWIGGEAEPLAYSGVGHLTRQIADLNRTVFVETDGVLLRRRVFSFRPVPRVFLTVRLNGTESSHDRRAGRPGVYRGAIEGIRAARLSGFMICLKTTVFEDTDLQDLSEFRKSIGHLGLDGWVVTPAVGRFQNAASEKKLQAVREMSRGKWAAFSRLVEASEAGKHVYSAVNTESIESEQPREEAYEQEVRVP
jgi:MoaA/NifB/PqqE/SkfB family radical SAM enzyme